MSTSTKRPLQVRDVSTGRLYHLESAAPLAYGGEAYIYAVQGEPSLLAKVYKPRNQESAADFAKRRSEAADKIAVMLANPPLNPTKPHPSYAWPTALVAQSSDSTVIGFLMPRIIGMKEVFEFYNPGRRREICPAFDYRYLHHTARNLAGIMHEVHSKGYVVADVNQKNILVSDSALVTLIDTDSFQVRDPKTGRLYLCHVGTMDFTAPELGKNKTFTVKRTVEQDLFGLAVLIFHLLMGGVHPFMGIEPGSTEPKTPQERVLAGQFTYAPGTRLKPMVIALPFEILHTDLRTLFIRCFVSGHGDPRTRPTAREWQRALDKAVQELRTCKANEKHVYDAHLGDLCPWCARVARGLPDPFPQRPPVRRQPAAQTPARATAPPPPPAIGPLPTWATAQPTKKQVSWGKLILYLTIIILVILRILVLHRC